MLTFGGEPFFDGRGGVAELHHWLVRELRGTPAEYPIHVWRDGHDVKLVAALGLGPYRLP
jgi:hypothetical protein